MQFCYLKFRLFGTMFFNQTCLGFVARIITGATGSTQNTAVHIHTSVFKLKKLFFGYFGPENTIFDNEMYMFWGELTDISAWTKVLVYIIDYNSISTRVLQAYVQIEHSCASTWTERRYARHYEWFNLVVEIICVSWHNLHIRVCNRVFFLKWRMHFGDTLILLVFCLIVRTKT